MLIDTHAHLDDKAFKDDIKEIIENFKKLYKSLPHTEKKIP